MSRPTSLGITRLTVASARRRVDIAVPETVPIAELLPTVLRHLGEEAADEGQAGGGWDMRRSDGTLVDPARSLSVQEIYDGEILHVVPRQMDWPELEYDDVIDAIATQSRRRNRAWDPELTRTTSSIVSLTAIAAGSVILLRMGPRWFGPGLIGLLIAFGLAIVAISLSRAFGAPGMGTALGAGACGYAALGGFLIAGGRLSLDRFGSSQVLIGSAALLLVGIVVYSGVANRTEFAVAPVFLGVVGIVAALLARAVSVEGADAAAICMAAVVVFMPTFPILSIRLGKLPVPALPTSTEELLADLPPVPLSRVHATVRRSDELLTGFLYGSTAVVLIGSVFMALRHTTSSLIYLTVVGLSCLLRARLFPATRHRIPLLVAGIGSGALLLAAFAISATPAWHDAGLAICILIGLAAVGVGVYYHSHRPTPYIGRIADWLDVLFVVAIVPMMCLVIGFFTFVHGLFG